VPARKRKGLVDRARKGFGTKRLRVVKKTRRQRAIEERGVEYDKLPVEMKRIVDGILAHRGSLSMEVLIVAVGAAYDMYNVSQDSKSKPIGAISAGAFAAIDHLVSDLYIRKAVKKLEQLVMESDNKRIALLRAKYPFFLIDRKGNLIFTTRRRILKLFGRLRGRTLKGGLHRSFPSPERVMKKQRKLLEEAKHKKT